MKIHYESFMKISQIFVSGIFLVADLILSTVRNDNIDSAF